MTVSDDLTATRGSSSGMTSMQYITSAEIEVFVDHVMWQYITREEFEVLVDRVLCQKTAIRNRETSEPRARTLSAIDDVTFQCDGPQWCSTCCIWLGTQSQLHDHVLGKKHGKAARKLFKRAKMAGELH